MNASTPDHDDVPKVVIYGDFNCPFSWLAHRRARHQQEQCRLRFDWRPIEHDAEIPLSGVPVSQSRRGQFEQELSQIREILVDGERNVLRVPTRRTNTRRINSLFASAPKTERADLARSVFDAYWVDDIDVNSEEFIEGLGLVAIAAGVSLAAQWQREWQSFDRRIVPMMQLPDGKLSRGLGVLTRLQ